MKTSITCFLLLIVLISCSEKADLAAIRSEIQDANKKFSEAFAAKDADAVASLYAEDAQLMPAHSPVLRGREEAKKNILDAMNAGVTGLTFTTEEVNGTRDLAYESGKFQVMVGDNVVDRGKYIVEWRKVGELWLISKDMFSTDLPAPRSAAQKDQVVGVAVWSVKKGNDKKFEDFVRNTLMPAVDRTTPAGDQAAGAVRFLAPAAPAENGSTKYIFIFDPMTKDVTYSIEKILIGRHGEARGRQLNNEIMSLSTGYEYYEMKQTDI